MASSVNIFSGEKTRYLAEKIAASYGKDLGKVTVSHFKDGEYQPCFEETIRGNDVFLVQSTFPPADNLFELLLLIDAAKRASAKRVVALIPYFGFARQDRKDRPRVSGGTKRAAAYAKFLNTDLVICFKQRSRANQIESIRVIGDVEGKDVVLVDDIIDTGGTITKSANLMMKQGANSVRAICTHPVFSFDAVKKIEDSALTEVLVTDTIPRVASDKITILSTADIFADVIRRVHKNKSISTHFDFLTIQ